MAKSEIRAWIIWFDDFCGGFKTYFLLAVIVWALWFFDDEYAKHLVVIFSVAVSAVNRKVKQMRDKL